MTRLVIEIPLQSDLDLLLPLLNRLRIQYIQVDTPPPTDDKITEALSVIRQGCNMANYGDALQYQTEQRKDRALPYRD